MEGGRVAAWRHSLRALIPAEMDANAVAAKFLRERRPEAINGVLSSDYNALAGSNTDPGPLSDLPTKMIAFLYVLREVADDPTPVAGNHVRETAPTGLRACGQNVGGVERRVIAIASHWLNACQAPTKSSASERPERRSAVDRVARRGESGCLAQPDQQPAPRQFRD
jgi:hypothetical protein